MVCYLHPRHSRTPVQIGGMKLQGVKLIDFRAIFFSPTGGHSIRERSCDVMGSLLY